MTKVLNKPTIKIKTLITVSAIALSVALPQLFHFIGFLSGTGAAAGAAFLPMHLPVLLAAFIGGPVVGFIAGIASPLISFLISGMPAAALLPFILMELSAYGIAGGFLSKNRIPDFGKLLLAQVAGRIIRIGAVLCAFYLFGMQSVQVSQIWTIIITGLPGILLQWAFIPLILYRLRGIKKHG